MKHVDEALQAVRLVESGMSPRLAFKRVVEGDTWLGFDPYCDFCQTKPQPWFVDGVTHEGPWALMCPDCFKKHGVGLGVGKGQKFDTKTKKKIE